MLIVTLRHMIEDPFELIFHGILASKIFLLHGKIYLAFWDHHSMCSSVVKQKNSKKCCKAKTFFDSSCGTCAQGCFFQKSGLRSRDISPAFHAWKVWKCPCFLRKATSWVEGDLTCFRIYRSCCCNLLDGPYTLMRKLKIFRSQKNGWNSLKLWYNNGIIMAGLSAASWKWKLWAQPINCFQNCWPWVVQR